MTFSYPAEFETAERWTVEHAALADRLSRTGDFAHFLTFLEGSKLRASVDYPRIAELARATARRLYAEGRDADAIALMHLAARLFAGEPRYMATGLDAFDNAACTANRARLQSIVESRLEAWEAGRIMLPAHAHLLSRTIPADFSHVRALLICDEHSNNQAARLKHEYGTYLQDSAKTVGLDLHLYHPRFMYQYPAYIGDTPYDPNENAACAAALLEFLHDRHYGLILFDANFQGGDSWWNADFVNSLRRETGAVIIAAFPDSIGGYKTQRYWAPAVDYLLVHEPRADSLRLGGPMTEKTIFVPYSVPVENDALDPVGREIVASFCGTAHSWRPFWLALLRHYRSDVHILATDKLSTDSPDQRGYRELLRRSKMVVSFPTRGDWITAIVARIYEAMLAGALVLEGDNPSTAALFVPYVHYIPYLTYPDLHAAIDLFAEREDLRQRVTDHARRFLAERYSCQSVWSYVLDRAGIGVKPAT